ELCGKPCEVKFLPIDLDDFDLEPLRDKDYAVVLLGAQLDVPSKDVAGIVESVVKYLCLLAGSRKAALEFALAWEPAKRLSDVVLSLLRPRIEVEVTLDLSQNEIIVDGEPTPAERLVRRLFILSEFQPFEASRESRVEVARILFGSEARRLLDRASMLQVTD